MKQLLEAGVHFGHQTSRWNPKMRPYIFGARNGIHIIDLQQTVAMFRDACDAIRAITAKGGNVLFVGTKKQAQDAVRTEALRCGQFYVNNRWLGGTLTNFETIKQSIERMRRLEEILDDPGSLTLYKKKERLVMQRDLDKLRFNLDGIKGMKKAPDVLFVIDPDREEIGVAEGNRLKIPVVAVVDTNCNPDRIAYCIPGNDDAIRAIRLFCGAAADAAIEGRAQFDERNRSFEKATPADGSHGSVAAFGAADAPEIPDAPTAAPVAEELQAAAAAAAPAAAPAAVVAEPQAAPAVGEAKETTES